MKTSTPVLEIDLRHIKHNYKAAQKLTLSCEISAVLKANAYGLGAPAIATALSAAGCNRFWLARAVEAIPIRAAAPNAILHILGGPAKDEKELYDELSLSPILNTREQIDLWSRWQKKGKLRPAALHIETGFNRLALGKEDLVTAQSCVESGSLEIDLLLTHLSYADTPDHSFTTQQLHRFRQAHSLFPTTRTSIASTYSLFRKDIAGSTDIARIGKFLYGLKDKPLTHPAVTWKAPVLQIHDVAAHETVGYDASWTAPTQRKIATLSIGYGDGLPRTFQDKGRVFFSKGSSCYEAPVTGKISMDLLCCDVTDIPDEFAHTGSWGYLIDTHHGLADFTERYGSLSYEALTHISPRVRRAYKH